jgi:hypothetical protein
MSSKKSQETFHASIKQIFQNQTQQKQNLVEIIPYLIGYLNIRELFTNRTIPNLSHQKNKHKT